MTTVVSINTKRKKAGLPLIRFDLRSYSDQDIADLRTAFAALYEITDLAPGDNRGFWAVARGHGYDQFLCHNDPSLFLTWHRAYVYWFEKALAQAFRWKKDDPELEITLPYWDWTLFDEETDAANGIPQAVDDETWEVDGETEPNPLKSAKSLYRVEALGLEGDQQFTHRYTTQLRSRIPLLRFQVESYYQENDYATFNNDFDFGAHGAIHVLVGGESTQSRLPGRGGDMSRVVSASFDPIFWLHHCMVDRVWFRWQNLHGNASVPAHVRTSTTYGGFTGEEVLHAESFLEYIYGTAPSAAGYGDTEVAEGSEEAPLPPTLTVPLDRLGGDFRKARLNLEGMQPPKNSYEVRVFVDQEGADAGTPTEGNDRYAGTLFFFGHGDCPGAPGHCNPNQAQRGRYDRRPDHPLRKRNFSLDVTSAVKAAAAAEDDGQVVLSFVVLDPAGEQVAPEVLDFDNVTVVAD